jgi:uncharacterized protein (TIRG00374 family)
MKRSSRSLVWRIGLGAVAVGVVVATFVFFLPTIADYGAVWEVVKDLSWPWIAALLGAMVVNLATFAPPWMVVLHGLSFLRAMQLTQATSALAIVVPGGAAAGFAGAFGMLRRWGFATRDIAWGVTLTGLWNQLLNLCFPVVAVFLLTAAGVQTATLATAAFIGVAVLGVVVTGLVLVLVSDRLAHDIGEVAARFADWALGKFRRGPVSWSGASFERFRDGAGNLLTRRWHLLTLTSLVGSLSVFAVLVVSLRAVGVGPSDVSLVEAFAAWALVRLIASVPITPGGIGVIELGLTGALVGFGGANAAVVAAVLVFRFLTVVPTLVLGLVAAATWRIGKTPPVADPAGVASPP